MGVDLYNSYWQAAFIISSLAAVKPLPSNQKQYPSNRLAKTYIFASEYRIHMGFWFFWPMLANQTRNMLVMLAVNSYMLKVIS